MSKLRVALAGVVVCLVLVDGKTFTRCDLVRELRGQHFPESDMRNWVCLVEAESGRRTDKRSPANRNGSHDYGLFQINDKYWCGVDSPGKDCNVKCSDLLTDDISSASTCAKKVFKRHGFRGWYGWRSKCQGGLPDISSCH